MSLGPELVVNGGFDTDTDWTDVPESSSWLIETGRLIFLAVSPGSFTKEQTISITPGKSYQVSVDTVHWSNGNIISVFLGGTEIVLSAVSYSGIVEAGATDSKIRFVGTAIAPESLDKFDNVSVREVLADDGGIPMDFGAMGFWAMGFWEF